MNNPGYQVFFTSDLHFHHKSIIKYCPDRLKLLGVDNIDDEQLLNKHDQWLMEMWNQQVGKKDHVYILGDFSFANVEWTQKFMGKLHGKKFLVLGNHDKTCSKLEMTNYFVSVSQIKEQVFKKSQWGFLEEDLPVTMCHYPMVTWNCKHYGAIQLHGHCHGRLDEYNTSSTDLRVDVGIDGSLAQYRLVTLEEVYGFFKKKTNGEKFMRYASRMKELNEMVI